MKFYSGEDLLCQKTAVDTMPPCLLKQDITIKLLDNNTNELLIMEGRQGQEDHRLSPWCWHEDLPPPWIILLPLSTYVDVPPTSLWCTQEQKRWWRGWQRSSNLRIVAVRLPTKLSLHSCKLVIGKSGLSVAQSHGSLSYHCRGASWIDRVGWGLPKTSYFWGSAVTSSPVEMKVTEATHLSPWTYQLWVHQRDPFQFHVDQRALVFHLFQFEIWLLVMAIHRS